MRAAAATAGESRTGVAELALSDPRLLQKLGAEAIGTLALVFAGCGAIVVEAGTGRLGHLGVAASFGLVIAVMIMATGHLSGAHFNPAVTLAFALFGRFPWRQVPAYVLTQAGAAVLGALLVRLLLGGAVDLGTTQPAGSAFQSFGLELVLTFLLMFVIKAVATDTRAVGQLAGLAIGATVALGALFGGPISGASMNPARSLGPALVSGRLDSLWIYLLAPVLGAAAGAWAYQLVRCDDDEATDVKGCC